MLISILEHLLHDILLIVVISGFLNISRDFRILVKDIILEVSLRQSESMDFLLSSIHELGFLVVANIVITDVTTLIHDNTYFE